MKAIVLTCSTGGGHNSCARYITEEFNREGIECDYKDYFEIIGEHASQKAEKIYLSTTAGNGKIFQGIYKLGELYNKTGIISPVYGLNKLAKNKLNKYIEKYNYDLIITTHVFPSMAATALKNTGVNLKLINVATDYECIPFWNETKPDLFVIPHKSLKKRFLDKGFSRKVLLPSGIPVSTNFRKTKNDLNIKTKKDIVLITSGSMGFGSLKEVVETLLSELPKTMIIVICGSNEKLYLELSEIKNSNLIIKGFVNNMNEYMAKSTVILTKPGGLTSTEVAVMNKPMVLMPPIPGVENYNANFYKKNKIALVATNQEEIINNTIKLINDKSLRDKMKKQQAKVINKNSAHDLVEFVKHNML